MYKFLAVFYGLFTLAEMKTQLFFCSVFDCLLLHNLIELVKRFYFANSRDIRFNMQFNFSFACSTHNILFMRANQTWRWNIFLIMCHFVWGRHFFCEFVWTGSWVGESITYIFRHEMHDRCSFTWNYMISIAIKCTMSIFAENIHFKIEMLSFQFHNCTIEQKWAFNVRHEQP